MGHGILGSYHTKREASSAVKKFKKRGHTEVRLRHYIDKDSRDWPYVVVGSDSEKVHRKTK